MPINGNFFDWESMEIQLPHGAAIDITEINYSDERPIEPRYGKGGKPRGYGRKNYQASGDMTLERQEFERLQSALGGSVYKGGPFPVVVSYANNDMPRVTDTLPDCKITKADTGGKQGDEAVGQVKCDFVILSPIKWGGAEAY